MDLLEKDGFLVVRNLLSASQVKECLTLIKDSIVKASNELGVTKEDYLSCTGRWATKSPITRSVSFMLDDKIKEYLENLLRSKITFKKSNVICKTSDITDPIPFHQDISYSPKDPYHFSLWVSLNDVCKDSAPLRVIGGSHKKQVETAADFWSPYFIDEHNVNNQNTRSITVNQGDAIIFDSKLWHGSDENRARKDRFAYVTRWVTEGKDFPQIPDIKPTNFGMFNCGELTNQILKESLSLFDIKPKILNKEALIMLWIEILTANNNFGGIDSVVAIKDLKKLNILNKACDLHDAGNISGLVYKNLWHSLLSILNKKIKLVKI
ncbi:phytanoyl-CoA dioxygenase family protein [Candidatus Phycorickettsia trachydisci]|nr:phytanoyl-CoA dioxygenase family protein [Candidatus Phycorickettsia trachydisci]